MYLEREHQGKDRHSWKTSISKVSASIILPLCLMSCTFKAWVFAHPCLSLPLWAHCSSHPTVSVSLPCCHLTFPRARKGRSRVQWSVPLSFSHRGCRASTDQGLCLLVSPPSSPSEPQPVHSLCQGQEGSCSGAQHTQRFFFLKFFPSHRVDVAWHYTCAPYAVKSCSL